MASGNLSNCLAWMGKLERTIQELGRMPRKLSIAVAPQITTELRKQFDRGTDPYGRKWRKLSTGSPSYLTKTGRLKRGTKAMPMAGGRAGVRIVVGAPYGIFHQTGTANMPARRILPQQGMPASWRVAITREMRRLLKEAAR